MFPRRPPRQRRMRVQRPKPRPEARLLSVPVSSTPFAFAFNEAAFLLVLSGDVNELAADKLREALAEATAHGTRSATVDLVDVTLLRSLAISALALTRRDLNQRPRPRARRRRGIDRRLRAADLRTFLPNRLTTPPGGTVRVGWLRTRSMRTPHGTAGTALGTTVRRTVTGVRMTCAVRSRAPRCWRPGGVSDTAQRSPIAGSCCGTLRVPIVSRHSHGGLSRHSGLSRQRSSWRWRASWMAGRAGCSKPAVRSPMRWT